MTQSLDLNAHGYTRCENDPGWLRCNYCSGKVYYGKGEKLIDLVRHTEACTYR